MHDQEIENEPEDAEAWEKATIEELEKRVEVQDLVIANMTIRHNKEKAELEEKISVLNGRLIDAGGSYRSLEELYKSQTRRLDAVSESLNRSAGLVTVLEKRNTELLIGAAEMLAEAKKQEQRIAELEQHLSGREFTGFNK